MDLPHWPVRTSDEAAPAGVEGDAELGHGPAPTARAARSPDELLRAANAIRRMLDDLDDDEQALRSRLWQERDRVRLEAAAQWRARGWRPITDSVGHID